MGRSRRHERTGKAGRRRIGPGVVVLVILAGAVGVWGWRHFRGPAELPDILLVSVDTLRADALGCYGDLAAHTSNMDRLAAAGTVFEAVISPVPITLPSHASMLTGLIPPRHGVRLNEGHRLPDSVVTLAEVLQERGYQTGAFIGGLPMKKAGGLGQGFDFYDDVLSPYTFQDSKVVTRRERYAEDVFAAAVAWLRSADRSRPVFAFVHVYDPHAPYLKVAPGATQSSYAGEIAHVDRELGVFLTSLAGLSRPRELLTVLTSDHGEGLGEHGEKTHCVFVYETTLRVPLIVHWPGVVEARRVRTEVGVIDVAPTILALAGLPALSDVEGRSLLGVMEDDESEERAFYFESLLGLLKFGWAPLRGVRCGAIKYIEAPRPELYDLGADPREQKNLHSARPDEAKRWARHLLTIGEGTCATAASDRETVRGLESLGYVSAPPVSAGAPSSRPDPKDCIAVYERYQAAHTESAMGHFDKALSILEEVESTFQDSALFYSRWGNFAAKADRWDRAISCYEKCLALDAGHEQARLNLGVAYLQRGDHLKALEHFEALLRVNPDHPEAHLYAGVVKNRHLSSPAEAAEHWRRFLELAPEHAQAESVRQVLARMPGR